MPGETGPRWTTTEPPEQAVVAVRMFVAVWPDEATRERLAGLDLDEKGLRAVGPERWHITLRFLGEVAEALVPALADAVRAAAAAVPDPVVCRLGPDTSWFTGVRVLQLPAEGLEALAAAVRTATLPLVAEPAQGEPPFNGHLTLARAKGRRRASPGSAALAGVAFDATFVVDRVDLVASTPSSSGHVYRTIATAPLAGAGPTAKSDEGPRTGPLGFGRYDGRP